MFTNTYFENPDSRTTAIIYSFLMIIASTISWTIYKSIYPNPNMVLDSYYYVNAAFWNEKVSAWPIGYSWIIRIIGSISRSAKFLVTIQYFFLQLSLLVFFLSIQYLFKLVRSVTICLFILLTFNPIYITISNFILSDSFFTAISILWLTNLIWLIISPKKYDTLLNGILLLLAFSIRYNALYYPIIGCLAIIISRINIKTKIFGIFFQSSLILFFIWITSNEMYNHYGVKQFSPFGSWKHANNALYMYEHVYLKNQNTIPLKFKKLDETVKAYYNSPHETISLFDVEFSSGSYYMFNTKEPKSPLVKYMDDTLGRDDLKYIMINYSKFSKLGPLYKEYGNYLISKYPLETIEYILLPNSFRYMLPLQEVLINNESSYVLRNDTLSLATLKWFGIKSLSASKFAIDLRTKTFTYFPIYHLFINQIFLLFIVSFFILKISRTLNINHKKSIFLIAVLAILNFLFSISVGSSLLRYQIFIITVESSFLLVGIQFVLREKISINISTSSNKLP